jgi:tRNA G26 N,N-dimethylase Trm1
MDLIIHYLKDKGFQAVRSHTDERGLKTNASIKTIENVIRGI